MSSWLMPVSIADGGVAACSGSAQSSGEGYLAQLECASQPTETGDHVTAVSSSDEQTTYSYEPVCIRGEGITGEGFYGCGEHMECGRNGHVYTVWAHHPDGTSEPLGSQCFQPEEAPPAARSLTAADVLEAFRRIPVPASEVVVQPPGGETLVNLDTVFSTEATPFTRTIGLLGHRVELAVSPSEYRWHNGDGTGQVTDWPGKSWTKGTPMHELITHRYTDASQSVQPRVDTTWSARYRVDGGPWQDVGGTVTITGEPMDLTVLSAAPRLDG